LTGGLLDELPGLDIGEPRLDDPFYGRREWPVFQVELKEPIKWPAEIDPEQRTSENK